MKEKILSLQQNTSFALGDSYLKLINSMDLLLLHIQEKKGFLRKFRHSPKGFYIYGNTGSGKTTIMNIFFEELKIQDKINIHFHDYFIDISRLLTKYTMKQLIKKISTLVSVMCFDEFFIESIADARLLQDLVSGLIKSGVIIVLTSNFAPEDLYKDGFNRGVIFPAFSNFLRENFNVHHLSTKVDFREQLSIERFEIRTPLVPFKELKALNLEFLGHTIEYFTCEKTTEEGAVVFEYSELFLKPRSILEFIYIARKFDKIYIKNFTSFKEGAEDELIRFRNFIDIAYIRNTIIFFETTKKLEEIFNQKMLLDIKIKRTYSRMLEMASKSYISNTNLQKRNWNNKARDFFESLYN